MREPVEIADAEDVAALEPAHRHGRAGDHIRVVHLQGAIERRRRCLTLREGHRRGRLSRLSVWTVSSVLVPLLVLCGLSMVQVTLRTASPPPCVGSTPAASLKVMESSAVWYCRIRAGAAEHDRAVGVAREREPIEIADTAGYRRSRTRSPPRWRSSRVFEPPIAMAPSRTTGVWPST